MADRRRLVEYHWDDRGVRRLVEVAGRRLGPAAYRVAVVARLRLGPVVCLGVTVVQLRVGQGAWDSYLDHRRQVGHRHQGDCQVKSRPDCDLGSQLPPRRLLNRQRVARLDEHRHRRVDPSRENYQRRRPMVGLHRDVPCQAAFRRPRSHRPVERRHLAVSRRVVRLHRADLHFRRPVDYRNPADFRRDGRSFQHPVERRASVNCPLPVDSIRRVVGPHLRHLRSGGAMLVAKLDVTLRACVRPKAALRRRHRRALLRHRALRRRLAHRRRHLARRRAPKRRSPSIHQLVESRLLQEFVFSSEHFSCS